MKRLIRWTTALAAALCVAGAAASAQQTSTSTPSTASQTATGHEQHRAPQEHLNAAKAALDDIPAESLAEPAKGRILELKRHVSSLEKAAAAQSAHGAPATSEPHRQAKAEDKENWRTDVAAVEQVLTELLGDTGTAGAPQPAGTSGTTSRESTGSPTGATIALDVAARTKLQEVRTHIAAFAASMRGSGQAGAARQDVSPAAAATTTPSSTETPASGTSPAERSTAGATAAQTTSTQPTPAEPAQTAPPTTTPPTTPGSAAQEAATQEADPNVAKRHLTAARDSLSELTQLPAAGELTGEARTQVSQLITNFNELITTNVDWKASYAKVAANLTALIGDQRTDESAAAPTAGTPGAVGTSGTVALDPAIRAKLVEFRAHLMEFEKAAGGGTPASAASANTPSNTAAPDSASEPPDVTGGPSSAGSIAGATGTAGTSASATPEPTGTSGTTSPEPQTRPAPARTQSTDPADSKEEGHAEAMRHVQAIDTILNGRAPDNPPDKPTGTSGTSTTVDRAAGLDQDDIQQIRAHLAELRRLLGQR